MELNQVQRVRFLYKTILRIHRGLPDDIRILGNSYVRDEFKRHKSCNQQEAQVFMTGWMEYVINLSKQLGLKGPKTGGKIGLDLKSEELDRFSEEQLHQLYELMLAAKK